VATLSRHAARFAAFLSLCIFAVAAPLAAGAESFDAAQKELDGKLESALRDLARTRDAIAKEKIPLSQEVARLEDEVLALREQRKSLLKAHDSRTIDMTSLRAQVASLREQDEFVTSRLTEFVRDFESRLDISEVATYEALTAKAKLADKDANLDALGKREARVAVVEKALERLGEQLGGQVYAGQALGPDGVLTEGTFVAVGPTTFYASKDGELSGLVEARLNAADPVVVPLPDGLGDGIAQVAQSGTGALPLDASLGKALKIEKSRKTFIGYLNDGGVVGYVIVVLGLVALGLTGFKIYEIAAFETASPELLDAILDDLSRGRQEAAAVRARAIEGAAGELLVAGVTNAAEKRGTLEELLFEKILRARPQLERFLPFLAITAGAAPLLGLLGTVTGMIKTFQLITIFGTGDAKSLSTGISEALITTAEGLIVAIPVLVIHGALSRMAKRKLGLLEELAVGFVNGVVAIRHGDENKPLAPGGRAFAAEGD